MNGHTQDTAVSTTVSTMTTVPAPTLPTELYIRICSLATATPHAFDLIAEPIGVKYMSYWREEQAGLVLLDVKAALSTVSQLFRATSLKYLFEVVVYDIGQLADGLSWARDMCLDSPVRSRVRHFILHSGLSHAAGRKVAAASSYMSVLEVGITEWNVPRLNHLSVVDLDVNFDKGQPSRLHTVSLRGDNMIQNLSDCLSTWCTDVRSLLVLCEMFPDLEG